jgi:hypothetical protein
LKRIALILCFLYSGLGIQMVAAPLPSGRLRFDFLGDSLQFEADSSLAVPFGSELSAAALRSFYRQINTAEYAPLINFLQNIREERKLDDWLFYQLVRKTAQQLAPKAENYYRYTLYKWFLMIKSGYDATLNIYNDQLLFYVYSEDEVFDIPLYQKNNRQYVCLNIHDYAKASGQKVRKIEEVEMKGQGGGRPFSYKVTRLPEFNEEVFAAIVCIILW